MAEERWLPHEYYFPTILDQVFIQIVFFFPEFHTIYDNTLSCTCLMPGDNSEASFGELLLFFECQDPFGSIGTF